MLWGAAKKNKIESSSDPAVSLLGLHPACLTYMQSTACKMPGWMKHKLESRTDAEAEAPILWSPDEKCWLLRKDPDAGKGWRQEKKGTTEDKMIGWHHWLSGHELEQAPGDGEGQGSLLCYSPWSCKESDTTEQLKNSNDNQKKWKHSLEEYF